MNKATVQPGSKGHRLPFYEPPSSSFIGWTLAIKACSLHYPEGSSSFSSVPSRSILQTELAD
jgi:hypothetical protein